MQVQLLIIVAGAVLFSLLVGVLAQPIGRLLGLLDYPDPHGGRKRHDRITPLVGGSAVMVPALVTIAWLAWSMAGVPGGAATDIGWLGLAAGSVYLLGVTDDRFNLSAMPRLLVTVSVFALIMMVRSEFAIGHLRFSAFPFPVALGDFGPLFTLLCLVGLLNAVNMADGKNGLVIGLALIWTACIGAYAGPDVQYVLAALGAALAVALVFNMYGRFFLGDGGSYGLSALLGLLAIYVYNDPTAGLSAGRIAVWFAIPVLDCVRLMLMRASKGRSPFSGDREHLHHLLGKLLGWPRGLLAYWLMVGLPCLATFLFPGNSLGILLIEVLGYATFIAVVYRRQVTARA